MVASTHSAAWHVGATDQCAVAGWALQSSVGNHWTEFLHAFGPVQPPVWVAVNSVSKWTGEWTEQSIHSEIPPWSQPSQLPPILPFQTLQDLCRNRDQAWPPMGVHRRWHPHVCRTSQMSIHHIRPTEWAPFLGSYNRIHQVSLKTEGPSNAWEE